MARHRSRCNLTGYFIHKQGFGGTTPSIMTCILRFHELDIIWHLNVETITHLVLFMYTSNERMKLYYINVSKIRHLWTKLKGVNWEIFILLKFHFRHYEEEFAHEDQSVWWWWWHKHNVTGDTMLMDNVLHQSQSFSNPGAVTWLNTDNPSQFAIHQFLSLHKTPSSVESEAKLLMIGQTGAAANDF